MMNTSLLLSPEEQNLYNPAYVGVILYHAIRECQAKNDIGLHCALTYLVAPLALSRGYSSLLPSTILTPIAGWAAEAEGHLVGFSESVSSYIEIVNSAIAYLLEREAVVLAEDGFYRVDNDQIPQLPAMINNNTIFKNSYQSAGFLGRWFASASSVEIIYTHFGVAP
jgi:hypothetical protein